MVYMMGLTKEEWERLKVIQREYNIRNSKIIDEMEKQINSNVKSPKMCKGDAIRSGKFNAKIKRLAGLVKIF